MSQFYWQLQANTQQQAKGGDKWSCVSLTNDNTNEELRQQREPYWWHQQNQIGTDPYSAAAFEGFRASSGVGNRTKSWQTSTEHDSCSTFVTQQQSEQISVLKYMKGEINDILLVFMNRFWIRNMTLLVMMQKPSAYPFALDFWFRNIALITFLKYKNFDQYLKQFLQKVLGEEYNSQRANMELDPGDNAEGNMTADTFLPAGKERVVSEAGSGTPVVAVAQIIPITTSTATATETSFSGNVLSCNQAFPAAVSSSANIAEVDPVSNHNSFGIPVNRVAPSISPVGSSACCSPLLLLEETGETQNAVAIDRTQADSDIISLTKSHQPDPSMILTEGQQHTTDSASNQLTKEVDDTFNSLPTDNFEGTQEQNELRQILTKDYEEHNTVIMTSAEQSTGSTAPKDFLSRPTEMHKDSKNVRDRYRFIRQQYPEVIRRLDRVKMETHSSDWRSMQKASLGEVNESSYRLPSRKHKDSAAINHDSNSTNPKNIMSMSDSRPPSKNNLNHSYTLPDRISSEDSSVKNAYYGEDLINSLRRNRLGRIRDHDYFPLRGTKSEMGEVGPYRGPALIKHRHMMQNAYGCHSSASAGYQYEYCQSGRHSLGPHSGRRAAHELAMMYSNDNYPVRRPQSSFDAPYLKYQQSNEFALDVHRSDGEEHSFGNGEESSGSDSEMARIHSEQEVARRTAAAHYNAMSFTAPNEFYYFGVIQLPQERVEYIMRKLPPPTEYFQLPAIEKAAYLFYCVLYRHHYTPVDLFHKKFNREYFSYMCEGDSAEVALWKICKHTQEEYIAKRSANQLKAYEMSQKQLFSDERETLDSRQSERGSRCDAEDDSDQLSIDSSAKEPMKFRVPHSFLKFGVGGKTIMLNVQNSENILEIRDMKSLFVNHELLCVSNAIESFRGPLIAGFTPTHSVHLYVQRQIELILKSEAYLLNPSNSLEADYLLIWQLLEMLVQQQGRVTGPDLSRLLMAPCDMSERRQHGKEKPSFHIHANFNERCVDSKAYDCFTQLLLGGHIKEALESAMKDGLYSDAMILARRLCVNEPQELEKIETAFFSHRSELNPVMTLLSVASGQPAPVLTSPQIYEANNWRSHAAIVLANLNTAAALGTVYQLGCALSHRGLHAAADFCFLAISLLIPSYNPFEPVTRSEDMNTDVRRHITLIHATLPGEMNFGLSKGFSIIDLHATEIFHYSIKLANSGTPVNFNPSIAYQLHRLDYAELISEFGNSADAFRYCVEIAKETWNTHHEIEIEQLERLYELAERLKYIASADANSTAWLPALRSSIDKHIEESKALQGGSTAVLDHDTEDFVGPIMIAKVSPETKTATNVTENGIQENDFANASVLHSEAVERNIGQDTINVSTISAKENEAENLKSGNNEYRMQPGQIREMIGKFNNTNASHSTLAPVLPASTNDFVESSIGNYTEVDSPLPQAKKQIPHETVQSYYDNDMHEWKIIKMEQTDFQGADSKIAAECRTDGNSTSTNSYENTPHRSANRLEEEIPDGITPTIAKENQVQGTLQSDRVPAVVLNSSKNQCQNFIAEHSFSPQQESNMAKKDEKLHNAEKTVNDHRQNSGLFSKLKATIAKAIPSSNEMILPDDKHPSIVWDPKLNRYVGEGIEEESVPEPPPSVAPSLEKVNGSTRSNVGGLVAARLSGGSRYFNPLIETSKPASHAAPLLPPVPVAASFGFIPLMPDNDEASIESPFSVHTASLPKETEIAE
ncbi:unnamed protein product [Litomosoides sigmodontis]|uniref:Protein transport protein sec16 n=1 Tax=Litomosoides sigmodontis TaxID=42156 RepID=A0A3P6TA19_LITSI|nr:unnamed protein product [Litomosoides sigmodontis]